MEGTSAETAAVPTEEGVAAAAPSSSEETGKLAEPEPEAQQTGEQSPSSPAASAKALMQSKWQAAVKSCVLFNGVSAAETKFVQKAAKLLETAVGAKLFSEGDAPSNLYLVHSGAYAAEVASADGGVQKLREYGEGDCFGACELLTQMGGRSCTITTIGAGLVWAIPQRVVNVKLKSPPTLPAGVFEFAKSVALFASLPKDRLQQLCRGAEQLTIKSGETVFCEDEPARTLFAVKQGTLTVESGSSSFLLSMAAPESFGEACLFSDGEHRVRRATVRASEGGATLVRWSAQSIETLVGYALQGSSTKAFNLKMLNQVNVGGRALVEGLGSEEVSALVNAMAERTFGAKEVVAAEGEVDEALFVVKSGEVVVRRGSKEELVVLKRGECFGEQALLTCVPTRPPPPRAFAPRPAWLRRTASTSTLHASLSTPACLALVPRSRSRSLSLSRRPLPLRRL